MKIQRASKLVAALALLGAAAMIPVGTANPSAHRGHIRLVQAQPAPNAQPVPETPQRLPLTPSERDAIRRQMQTMLRSLNRILHGVADGNTELVRTAARASGKAIALDPLIDKTLSPQYAQLVQRTHLRFDQLADASTGRSIPGNVVPALAMITGYCAACHDMFRVDEIR